jgi:hypothetical protein
MVDFPLPGSPAKTISLGTFRAAAVARRSSLDPLTWLV